jgi:acetyl-CoA C-acetyltransferase
MKRPNPASTASAALIRIAALHEGQKRFEPWRDGGGVRKAAIVSAGLTLFGRRMLETSPELCFEASRAALDGAGLEPKDIDAVVIGSAPDAFDGVHMKGEYLAEGSAALLKPASRVYVGGATGVYAAIAGWWHIASGLFDTVLVVCEEKMSPLQPHPQLAFWTIFDYALERPLGINLLWIFSLQMTQYMRKYGASEEDIALVSVKNKRNALDHPSAQAAQEVTVKDVLESEPICLPVRRLMVSPVSDGAVAIVMASEEKARRLTDAPIWVKGAGWCVDDQFWTARDLAHQRHTREAAQMAYRMAKVDEPRTAFDLIEPYDPFAHLELVNLESLGVFEKGEAYKATREGITARSGALPSSPSGGLLGVGNPIAAAGLMKVAECFLQLRGEAGRRQVPITKGLALAHSWGDLLQASTVLVLGT